LSSTEYIQAITTYVESFANPIKAAPMEAYMKHKFRFYGITSTERASIFKAFNAMCEIPQSPILIEVLEQLFHSEYRELHYWAMDLAVKTKIYTLEESLPCFEKMIITNSWWDTVDLIASKLIGRYFLQFPKYKKQYAYLWNKSTNIWLIRTSILFQLKYKENIDYDLLSELIENNAHQKEFFIKKAIGWILREISKHNPQFVHQTLANTTLQALSVKEASKYL
jgi:3-methyladenine DNA glycosylase AlkD